MIKEKIIKAMSYQEDERIINSSNTNKEPKICFVYLASPAKSKHSENFGKFSNMSKMAVLILSLKTIKGKLEKYPIIIFHEDFKIGHKRLIEKECPKLNIKFRKVNFKEPKGWNPKVKGRPYGYRKMCKFFSGEVQNHKALENYDYYIRMDHDSFFTEPMNFKPEEIIKKYDFDYMYRSTCYDGTDKGKMWTFTKMYAQLHDLNLKHFKRLKLLDSKGQYNGKAPYTNFHMSKISFWKRKDVKEYIKTMNLIKGCTELHWEDTTTNAIILGLFGAKVLEKTDFGYEHNEHKSILNSLKVIYEGKK